MLLRCLLQVPTEDQGHCTELLRRARSRVRARVVCEFANTPRPGLRRLNDCRGSKSKRAAPARGHVAGSPPPPPRSWQFIRVRNTCWRERLRLRALPRCAFDRFSGDVGDYAAWQLNDPGRAERERGDDYMFAA